MNHEQDTFGGFLEFLVKKHGARPEGTPLKPGIFWTLEHFADVVGVNVRTIRYWLRDEKKPDDLRGIERALFGTNQSYDEWRVKLRSLHSGSQVGRPTTNSPRHNAVRAVYLSAFDISDPSLLADTVLRKEAFYSERLFAYGSMADYVTFQFSAPLKSSNLPKAIQRFSEGFRRDEHFQLRPIFRYFTSPGIIGHSDYLKRRKASGILVRDNVELMGYEKADAAQNAQELDRLDLALHDRSRDVAADLVRRVARAVSSIDPPRRLAHAMSEELNDPVRFQSFAFRKAIEKVGGLANPAVKTFLHVGLRGIYHRSNATAASASTDLDPEWSYDSIAPFVKLANPRAWVEHIENLGSGLNICSELFRIRRNPTFIELRSMYFLCQNDAERSRYLSTLAALVARHSRPTIHLLDEVHTALEKDELRYLI